MRNKLAQKASSKCAKKITLTLKLLHLRFRIANTLIIVYEREAFDCVGILILLNGFKNNNRTCKFKKNN